MDEYTAMVTGRERRALMEKDISLTAAITAVAAIYALIGMNVAEIDMGFSEGQGMTGVVLLALVSSAAYGVAMLRHYSAAADRRYLDT